jgi:hypothetical protein
MEVAEGLIGMMNNITVFMGDVNMSAIGMASNVIRLIDFAKRIGATLASIDTMSAPAGIRNLSTCVAHFSSVLDTLVTHIVREDLDLNNFAIFSTLEASRKTLRNLHEFLRVSIPKAVGRTSGRRLWQSKESVDRIRGIDASLKTLAEQLSNILLL